MQFIPEQPESVAVPYYDDVSAEAGWQGHATSKSLDVLKSEVIVAIGRLGGVVAGFQRGAYELDQVRREGFQIHYQIANGLGAMIPCRLDVAALPVKDTPRTHKTYTDRLDKSLKMALYMLRNALEGLWFLQQLSPGFVPLMPWMIAGDTGKTMTQLWQENAFHQLTPGGDFVEGEYEV